jgi:proteasome lid subunit RPN8/RPN11
MPRIPRAVVEEMVAHAREDLPNEACGIVHARDGVPCAVHRLRNVAGAEAITDREELRRRTGWADLASPFRYLMDPLALARLEQQRDESGEQLFAIYHSHVASEAYPSPTDVRTAFLPPGAFDMEPMYPRAYYILVSMAHDPPQVRAFHIRSGGVVEEEPVEVLENG